MHFKAGEFGSRVDRDDPCYFAVAMMHGVGLLLRTFAVGLASLILTSAPAFASGKATQERAARKACLDGDYAKGVGILSNLFLDTKDPTHVFNQGRCFEQNRHFDEAIARFQEYLRLGQGKLKPADSASAEQHIADCRAMLAQERGAAPVPAEPQMFVPPPAPLPPPAANPQMVSPLMARTTAERAPSSDGSGLRVAGVVTASVGLAAIVGGIVFNTMANNAIADMESAEKYTSGKDSDNKTYKALAVVGYGLGAACVVTGAVLYGIGLKAKANSPSNVALVPAVGVGQVGAVLTGAF